MIPGFEEILPVRAQRYPEEWQLWDDNGKAMGQFRLDARAQFRLLGNEAATLAVSPEA
jgi:hypothetical protein